MNWRSGVRWFAAEFLVVVTGVLVALSVQSCYKRREERRSETSYLRQLASDLRQNEVRLARNLLEDSITISKALGMLRFMRSDGPLRPLDSLIWWASISTPTLDVVTGTLSALTQTGDIRLIRSDALRGDILTYAALVNAVTGRVNLSQERAALHSATRTARMIEHLPDVIRIDTGLGEPEAVAWWRYVNYAGLRADKEAEAAFQSYVNSRANNLAQVRLLVLPTQQLRQRTENNLHTPK